MTDNKYYIADNAGLRGIQLINMKKNNYYLYRAFVGIYKSVVDKNPKIGGFYRPQILAGELLRTDEETGFNTDNLALKLRFLVVSLREEINVRKFRYSFLALRAIEPMYYGTLDNPKDQWYYYKPTADCLPAFKDKSSFVAALLCQRNDDNAPLGLNFSKLIDTLVQTDGNGNYYIDGTSDPMDYINMGKAVAAQLAAMKSHPKFKSSFYNPEL